MAVEPPAASGPSPCPADWEAELCQLKSVVEVLKKSHVTELDMPAFLAETIRLGVRTLPYAVFRTAAEQVERQAELLRERSGAVGLGIMIEQAGDLIRVTDLVDGGPAQLAGVQPGDLMLAVDEHLLRGVPLAEVSKFTRGAAGTPVRLALLRGVPEQRVEVTVTRALVRVKASSAARLPGGVLWTRLENFPETAVGDYVDMVQAERAKAPVSGVLLDLRRNGGGALNAAVGITAAFAGRGKTVMVTQGRSATENRRYSTNWPDYELPAMKGADPLSSLDDWWRSVPLVVLVDGQSASAAEATAAALKDLGRAKLLGLPTYGKGLAQIDTETLNGTRLTWTSSRNLRPSGCAMEGWGVTPDWWVVPRQGADVTALLLARREMDIARPAYLDRLHPNPLDAVRKQRQQQRDALAGRTASARAEDQPLTRKEFAQADDWQVKQALAALAGLAVDETVHPSWPAELACAPLPGNGG